MLSAPRNAVPIFPLPNLVLFPHTQVPLHVFELRYRTMVRDALSGERVLALALLKRGWEPEYEESPAFHELGCLAQFEEVEWLPNDCYQLVVKGVTRVRFGRVTREFPYRAARVSLLQQEPYTEDDPLVLSERQGVMELLLRGMGQAAAGESPPQRLEKALAEVPYEQLVNLLCSQLQADAETKLELLALDSILARGRRARDLARRRPAAPPPPPADQPGERN